MSRTCELTKKRPQKGNNVSHAKNRTRRTFDINLQTKKFWSDKENKMIKLKVSTHAMRTIDKYGLDKARDLFNLEK